jgi:hypothetical protein
MGTMLHSESERVHLTLTVGLFAACLANMMLVCAWL